MINLNDVFIKLEHFYTLLLDAKCTLTKAALPGVIILH